jgi:hypothetical protein
VCVNFFRKPDHETDHIAYSEKFADPKSMQRLWFFITLSWQIVTEVLLSEGLPTQSPPFVESAPRYHSEVCVASLACLHSNFSLSLKDIAAQIQALRTPQDPLRSPSRQPSRPVEWTTTERADLYPSAGLPRLDACLSPIVVAPWLKILFLRFQQRKSWKVMKAENICEVGTEMG